MVIVGRSLVVQTLARLASAVDFKITVIASGATREFFPTAQAIVDRLDLNQVQMSPAAYVVVATQGESDEEALEQVLRHSSRYLAFVVSKTKR